MDLATKRAILKIKSAIESLTKETVQIKRLQEEIFEFWRELVEEEKPIQRERRMDILPLIHDLRRRLLENEKRDYEQEALDEVKNYMKGIRERVKQLRGQLKRTTQRSKNATTNLISAVNQLGLSLSGTPQAKPSLLKVRRDLEIEVEINERIQSVDLIFIDVIGDITEKLSKLPRKEDFLGVHYIRVEKSFIKVTIQKQVCQISASLKVSLENIQKEVNGLNTDIEELERILGIPS